MIPQRIHYCWFGKTPQSDLNRRCLDSWHKMLPDYQIKEWNETNIPLNNAYAQAAYAGGLWSKLSNHIRLHALYTEGGIYLDTDIEVLKNFAPLLRHKCFLGFQQAEEDVDWVNSAVLGAQSGHEFLKRGMELTQKLFAETGEFYRSPTVMTMLLREMGLREYGRQEIKEVTVYPKEYFYPYPWYGEFSPDCITADTYCVHYWEASWRKQEHYRAPLPLRILKRMVRTLRPKAGK
jgi:mannosyltransferase OCH1-like enzyme